MSKKYKLGLVLSGGGARGMFHLGAIKAFYEFGYEFDIISGTSMGSIIGALIADGHKPDVLAEMFEPKLLKSLIHADISFDSLVSMNKGISLVRKLLSVKKIEDLKIPLVITATELYKGEAHHFYEGDISKAIRASSCIPVGFAPVKIGKNVYVDGGLLNNLPARCIADDCEKIIGIHVNPKSLGLHNGKVKGIAQIAIRSIYLAMLGSVLADKEVCDLYIEPKNLENYSVFDFVKSREIFEIGYTEVKAILEGLDGKLEGEFI